MLRAHHNGKSASIVLRKRNGAQGWREMHIQIADRFPAGIVYIHLKFPFPVQIANRPEGDPTGDDLRQHEGRRSIRYECATGPKLPIQMQSGLTAIDDPNVGERLAIRIHQWCIERADVEAQGCIFAVDFERRAARRKARSSG